MNFGNELHADSQSSDRVLDASKSETERLQDYARDVFDFDLVTIAETDERNWRQMSDIKDLPNLVNNGDLSKAESIVADALQKYPDFGFVHLWNALLCEKKGQLEKAKLSYEEGIIASTGKTHLCHRLGMFEFNHGTLKGAVKWWIRSILLQFQSSRIIDAVSFLYLSHVADCIGDTKSASKLLALSGGGVHRGIEFSDAEKKRLKERCGEQKDLAIGAAIASLTSRHWNGALFKHINEAELELEQHRFGEKAQRLMEACWDGNYEAVKALLDGGISANQRDKNGGLPIISAASKGYRQIVELLIEKGANVNGKEIAVGHEFTAIRQAKALKHPDVVEILSKAGAIE